MQTLSIDNNAMRNHVMANALMSMFKVMDTDTQLALLKRLSSFMAKKSAASTSNHAMSLDEARNFLNRLVVRGGETVPAEEDGMDAWVESKYQL